MTGVLLVGGASRRFGSPKALARLEGETLAQRAHRTLAEAFGEVLVLGKVADALSLPFPVVDDGSELRAPIVGVAAALRLAPTATVVVLPTDVPFASSPFLLELAAASHDVDVAHHETGPLPGAYRRTALPVLERRIAAGELGLRGALAELRTTVVAWNSDELRNVNTVEELEEVRG